MLRAACLIAILLGFSPVLPALDPLPDVQQGPGYRTWTLEQDLPLVKLEDALLNLRSSDRRDYLDILQKLGITKQMEGRELAWPELVQPMAVDAEFLSFERRKMAVLTAPVNGRHKWYAVLLRQEGNGEAYWRARQVFIFDTDPILGLTQAFPDILGDDIRFWQVGHIIKDDIYGRARVASLFKWDERGRARLTFQEMADAYRSAKFIGQAQRLDQKLVFKGDQRIVREIILNNDPWMKREEWEHYTGVQPRDAKPAKLIKVKETFAWDPADFNFYQSDQELEKLVRNKSPFIRREAARRLGEHLKSAHPQLIAALSKDKDQMVRMQVALALGAIGDAAALPAVQKQMLNTHEPDENQEALRHTEALLLKAPTPTPTAVVAKAAPAPAAALLPVTQPKISEK